MSDFSFIPPTSVVTIPGANASAAFTAKTSEVFKEEHNIAPIIINDKMKYIPWGGDNQMPYNIIDLIESDETMSTCQMFNAEICYGSGLVYDTKLATAQVQSQVDDFMLDNDLASYFLGVCQDFKHFGFCISVIILNEDASRIVRIVRKQACYSTTSRLPTRFGTISSRSRASRIVSSSRNVSTRRRTTSSTSLPAWRTAVRCFSPRSMFHPMVRMCFTMRVHSNLVGSVSGKSQTNNSGSDKRELYTIAQALQKPYHDLLFSVHRLIIRFNKWQNVTPDCPFIQLTTLDENKDAKQVSLNKSKDNGNADK